MTTAVKIFRSPGYVLLSILVSLMVIIFAAWLPNLHLITRVMTSASMTLWQKTNLLTGLLGSIQTNFTPFSRIMTIMSGVLTGIQFSLLMYYLRRSATAQIELGASAIGIGISLLGVGCASCGSVVLTSLIGFAATTSLLGILPMRGQEFSFLGIGILLIAIRYTTKKINEPMSCKIPK